MYGKVWLQEMTWEEVKERIDEVGLAIIPVGSTEQHGRHLPVGTDTFVAIKIAEDVAKETGAVVAPPVWFGWSPHHMCLPGTINVRPEVLVELLYDIGVSLVKHGFKKLIVVNGHRIVNLPWLQMAAFKIKNEVKAKVYIVDPSYIAREAIRELGFGPISHGDEQETSHMLYLKEELVNLKRAKDKVEKLKKFFVVDPGLLGDTVIYIPSSPEEHFQKYRDSGGTGGAPSKATLEKGRELHEKIVGNIVELIKEIKEE